MRDVALLAVYLQFCIVLILPSRKAAWGAARTVYTALKDLAAKYKRDPVKLVWVDAEKQASPPTIGENSGRCCF